MWDSLVWLSAKMLYHKRAMYMNEKKTTKHMNKLKIQECQIFQVQPVFGECKITRAQVNNSSITQLYTKNTLSGDDIL